MNTIVLDHAAAGPGLQPDPDLKRRLKQLRPFPPVALKAFEMLASEETPTKALVEVVSPDPAFVAELLRCANSALFGVLREVKTVQHAVVVIGRERLRAMIMTAALRSFKRHARWTGTCHDWWRHSVASALLSEGLASAARLPSSEAYSGGLLHDIGRLGLLLCMNPQQQTAFQTALSNTPSSPDEFEHELFGIAHSCAGADMLAACNLPQPLVEAARVHHHSSPGDGPVARLAAASCHLASTLGFAFAPGRPLTKVEDALALVPELAESGLTSLPDTISEALATRIESLESAAFDQRPGEKKD